MRKWIPLLIIVAAVVASAIVYPRLPASVPTHWDASGHVNGWSSRLWGAWLMPVILLAMWALLKVLPAIDPRGANYPKFEGAFEGIIIAIMLFLLGLHIIVLRAALGYAVPMERVMPVGMGALLIIIGILLPRAQPNWFIGIRTPWTLSSDRVWEKTHRFGGRVFVAGGVVILIAGLLISRGAHIVLFAVITLCAASVLLYSYLEWRRERSHPESVPPHAHT
jgi:immunity protein, SdpI family